MIPRSPALWQTEDWQHHLANLIRDPAELLSILQLDHSDLPEQRLACDSFALRAPRPYVDRIRRGDPNDPLLLQILPQGRELNSPADFVADPLHEQEYTPTPGLIHKYRSRVLLITAPSCAINCRYCFRREFPYSEHRPKQRNWRPTFDYLREHPEVNEVILSGGDPLMMPDHHLAELIEQLAELPQLTRLRIHTRLPIVIPQRITGTLLQTLQQTRLQTIVVIHCNHPQEIDDTVADSLQQLRHAGITAFNQSVLLRGINDCAETLSALSETLFACGVLPYYLHLLDSVEGAAHFAIPDEQARALYRELLARLPGFLVPKLVREEPGERSKTPYAP